jgi:hypothetical protein
LGCFFIFPLFLFLFFCCLSRSGFKTGALSGRSAKSAREVATPLYFTAKKTRTPPPPLPRPVPAHPPPLRVMVQRAPPPPLPSAPPPTVAISWNTPTSSTPTTPPRTGDRCTAAPPSGNSRSFTGSHKTWEFNKKFIHPSVNSLIPVLASTSAFFAIMLYYWTGTTSKIPNLLHLEEITVQFVQSLLKLKSDRTCLRRIRKLSKLINFTVLFQKQKSFLRPPK